MSTQPQPQLDIFELRQLISNLSCKLSTISSYDVHKQMLCLVSEENDIVLRYTADAGQEVLKMISWFRRTNRVIHDVCFDPTGTWLLVLCFDNTLHIVPALAVVDKSYIESSSDFALQQQQHPYSTTQITSYIIPFVGPHECPNSQQCPNPNHNPKEQRKRTKSTKFKSPTNTRSVDNDSTKGSAISSEYIPPLPPNHTSKSTGELSTSSQQQNITIEDDVAESRNLETFSHDVPASMLPTHTQPNCSEDKTGNSQVMAASFMASATCPYPLSVVWWRTTDAMNRAIIGYSDGSICFVSLTPNCPFVASTAIESGSVVKMLICKETSLESVMLILTSSLKRQFKLLLEQKTIKYIYPGDISPSSAQPRESDWQIVMPLKLNVSASDSSQLDEDLYQREDGPAAAATAVTAPVADSQMSSIPTSHSTGGSEAMVNTNTTAPTLSSNGNNAADASGSMSSNQLSMPMPPPPPYSVAISGRSMESAPLTTIAATGDTTAGARFTQQQPQLSDAGVDDFNGRAGILPAARARLASLKSLGSKKLNAIKMRLSDNRQKLDEYIPENTLTNFAIMDSPSFTPEPLSNSTGSFYTIQNLRSAYLLSALHSQTDTLSVHAIDISLKSLFVYKIPKNCYDILISSNILYSIQYVCLDEQQQQQRKQEQQQQKQDKQQQKGQRGLQQIQKRQEKQAQQQQLSLDALKDKENVALSKDGQQDEPTENKENEKDDKQENTEKEQRNTDIEKQEKEQKSDLKRVLWQGQVNRECETCDMYQSEKCSEMYEASEDSHLSHDSSKQSLTTSSSPKLTRRALSTQLVNAVGVLSSAMASTRANNDGFNAASLLGLFHFEHETVLNLYQMATYRTTLTSASDPHAKEEPMPPITCKDIRSPMDYVQFYRTAGIHEEYSLRQMEIMQSEFPHVNYDPCYVVTNKNVYYIQLKREPFAIFLEAATAGDWERCRNFCNIFDLNYETCIEFAGDYMLRNKRVTQALITYNTARIKPIRTALKLAMFGQTYALMHLCAMALKITHVLKSQHFSSPILRSLLADITLRHSEDVRGILPVMSNYRASGHVVNEGASCSDYAYGVDDSLSNLQLSASSQFHLSNLLLITLAEKAVDDKNYLPLWNFLVINFKYHTNMTSIVLCQSGLYSSAVVLAKARGVCLDTFAALTSVMAQEFGWYSELNVCLYNLSESMYTESITYMPHSAFDYFIFIQDKIESIRLTVLQRLECQLNPFSAILRPIVSHSSTSNTKADLADNNLYLFEFCKNLIETYLAVLVHIDTQRSRRDCITNALSTFHISYEDNQFAIESARFKPISAGCAHCACVVDGIAYFWGSNGVPCNFSASKCSDPPEPPHAVKGLELLSQLNLEVHAVKCGRQHTLILTNNGLYAFGNNNYCQLGIGRHMDVSLQPMLISAFDGMNITILEAGQYHNAVVADGLLYTWGWGIHGQLGHGNTESVKMPKIVSFFKFKKVIQVSLGHAHSLVLCQAPQSTDCTELYVFGSNHFGQLGLGSGVTTSGNRAADDEFHCANEVKCLVPQLLRLSEDGPRIRLIHTKFFTNLAVDETERLYTWGSSPQALRLANQIRRRANAKQKLEEYQKREMFKRFDTVRPTCSEEQASTDATQDSEKVEATSSTTSSSIDTGCQVSLSDADAPLSGETTEFCRLPEAEVTETPASENVKELLSAPLLTAVPGATHLPTAVLELAVVTKEADASVIPIAGGEEQTEAITKASIAQPTETAETSESSHPARATDDTNSCEHMTPQLVDTSKVAGQILQLSSGLFHCAMISSSCTLYTWGKNLEHQLGTEDKERRAVLKPSPIDSIERPMYVDCGADFTLVMTTDYVVKAFGGNSNGQCGRDLGATLDKTKQRMLCLPATKRLMRFESQCVEVPVEINLPRPRIRLDTEPVRYLKSIPNFQAHFVQEAAINFDDISMERAEDLSKSTTTQLNSSENALSGQESDDIVSSLENVTTNGRNATNTVAKTRKKAAVCASDCECDSSCDSTSPEEQSYTPLPAADNGERRSDANTDAAIKNATREESASTSASARGRIKSAEMSKESSENNTSATEPTAVESDEDDEAAIEELKQLRHYIHYCLYAFHGLYSPDKMRELCQHRLEYRIRTLMLNFKFIDAFTLCLEDCGSARKSLKIFEYFTRDSTGCVPLQRQDQRYLIYYLLLHFLARKFDLNEAERFFLADLDFYLFELAYVLYFNNNNTELEQNLNQKFKSMIAQEDSNNQTTSDQRHKLEDTDVIFDSLSILFKTLICQRLIKHFGN